MNELSYTTMAQIWEFAETHAAERQQETYSASPDQTQTAHPEQHEPQSAAQSQLLTFLAKALHASSIISVGTDAVEIAMALLEGLGDEGQLTAVDSSTRGVSSIRKRFSTLEDTGENRNLTLRAVNAAPAIFLSRLNQCSYDLIVVSGATENYASTFEQAPYLLKEHGLIVLTDMLGLSPAANKGKADAMSALITTVEEDERFVTALTPTGTGLLLAARR